MAQHTIQLDRERLSCSICLDLLKEPVTIPCGHSYCMSCIGECWGEDGQGKTHSCPQCRQSFAPRPALVKSTMLSELVDEVKRVAPEPLTSDQSYAGAGDVACDFCTGRKLRASKSCLSCLASYCERHLQPHYDVAPLKKHALVEATLKLQENVCSRHDEVMKVFCRTDQRCICYLCSMEEHSGHVTVSAAAERAERQAELGLARQRIQQRIQDRVKDVTALQGEVEAIDRSADKAVGNSEGIFAGLIGFLERRSSEVKRQIRSQQRAEVSQVKELEEKLQQEITQLRRKDADLERLARTEDHLHFLNSYRSLSHLGEPTDAPSANLRPQQYFVAVTAAVSKARDEVQAVLSQGWEIDSLTATQGEPKTRPGFLRYSQQITLDPNTAHARLSLCDRNRKATLMKKPRPYPGHPDRFTERWQVLSREGLTGRCYWEVEWSGTVYVAVTYQDISRMGECGFGNNDKSWSLRCSSSGYKFRHNNTSVLISDALSSRVGVYLDHVAGTLSFYSVSDTMTLLHRVQTTFTRPLYPGFWLPGSSGGTAELCELK